MWVLDLERYKCCKFLHCGYCIRHLDPIITILPSSVNYVNILTLQFEMLWGLYLQERRLAGDMVSLKAHWLWPCWLLPSEIVMYTLTNDFQYELLWQPMHDVVRIESVEIALLWWRSFCSQDKVRYCNAVWDTKSRAEIMMSPASSSALMRTISWWSCLSCPFALFALSFLEIYTRTKFHPQVSSPPE